MYLGPNQQPLACFFHPDNLDKLGLKYNMIAYLTWERELGIDAYNGKEQGQCPMQRWNAYFFMGSFVRNTKPNEQTSSLYTRTLIKIGFIVRWAPPKSDATGVSCKQRTHTCCIIYKKNAIFTLKVKTNMRISCFSNFFSSARPYFKIYFFRSLGKTKKLWFGRIKIPSFLDKKSCC